MPMIKADGILSPRVRDVVPDDMKTQPYIKAERGFIGTIVKVVYYTFEVPKKDEAKHIVYDENGLTVPRLNSKGEIVYNTTAIVKWAEGGLTSFNGRTALSQLVSLTGEYPRNEPNVKVFDTDPCKVKIITKSEKFGNEEYDKPAFDPLD